MPLKSLVRWKIRSIIHRLIRSKRLVFLDNKRAIFTFTGGFTPESGFRERERFATNYPLDKLPDAIRGEMDLFSFVIKIRDEDIIDILEGEYNTGRALYGE